ncbi:MAG TPA: hypothetical protein VJV05_00835, partial [Pyrinomonadaceae bacterium]|nr:hypothetical protein [Pyrinomonadaceae bacterium]
LRHDDNPKYRNLFGHAGETPAFQSVGASLTRGSATANNEQRTTNNEQRTTNNEQRSTNNEQRPTIYPPLTLSFNGTNRSST